MPIYYVQRLSPLQFQFSENPPSIFSKKDECSEIRLEILELAERGSWEGPLKADNWRTALMRHYKIGPKHCHSDNCYDWILGTCKLQTNDDNDFYDLEAACGGQKGEAFCFLCEKYIAGCDRCKDFEASFFLIRDRSGNIEIIRGCTGIFPTTNIYKRMQLSTMG